MGVMCNNSFVIQIKTEGYSLSEKDIQKMLTKRFGWKTYFNVKEYIPPNPIPRNRTGSKKAEQEKVFCNDCVHYTPKSKWTTKLDDVCEHKSNLTYETIEDTYLKQEHKEQVGHKHKPEEKNEYNDCSHYAKSNYVKNAKQIILDTEP